MGSDLHAAKEFGRCWGFSWVALLIGFMDDLRLAWDLRDMRDIHTRSRQCSVPPLLRYLPNIGDFAFTKRGSSNPVVSLPVFPNLSSISNVSS